MPMFYRLSRPLTIKAGLSGLIAVILVNMCSAAAPTAELRLAFTASRNGVKIGPHTISITRDGDSTVVTIASHFVVKVAFITLYRFDHESKEIWRQGKFWSLQAKSDDNGTLYQFTGHAENDKFVVDGFKDKQAVHKEVPDMPSAGLWGAEMAHGTELLNTLTGLPVKVQIKDLGDEQVIVRGAPVTGRHFQITGELVQDDWYDKDGNLIRKVAKGPDGSDIKFDLL